MTFDKVRIKLDLTELIPANLLADAASATTFIGLVNVIRKRLYEISKEQNTQLGDAVEI